MHKYALSLFFPVLILAASVILIGGYLTPTPEARGATIEELRRQIEEKNRSIKALEEKAAAYKQEIKAHEAQAKTLANHIALLNARIKKLSNDIALTQDRIKQKSLEILELSIDIERQEAEIRKHRIFLAEVIRTIHLEDERPLLATMLAEPNLSSLFNQIQYSENLQGQIQEELDVVQTLKANLEKEKGLQEQKKNDLESLQSQLSSERSAQAGARGEQQQVLSETKQRERRFQQLLSDVQKKQRDAAKEIYELEEKLRRALNPNRLPGKHAGVLSWPSHGKLTQRYGPTSKTGFQNHVYNFHNGIDIADGFGSPVMAARDGKVVGVGNNGRYAYGKWVAIRHDNGLTTLYGHLSSINVSNGKFVRRGETIGLEGSTGFSTGSHVHFTVYDSSTFNVIDRFYGPLPVGASVNPMDYLP